MLTLGALSFVAPAALFALLVLPVLWWLLRLIPPAPQRVRFPAIRFVMRLINPEESSAKTPLWLIILRTALILLLILAAAHPVLNAGTKLDGAGPLVLVVDDDWAAAKRWNVRQTALANLIDQAARENRTVALITTAPEAPGSARAPASLLAPESARDLALALKPKPWAMNRKSALALVDTLNVGSDAQVVWLSNGLDDADTAAFAAALAETGALTVLGDLPEELPSVLLQPSADRKGLTVRALRAGADDESEIVVQARNDNGNVVVRQPLIFADGARDGETRLDLPVELRNRLARIEIEGEKTAAAVVLLDERWRRRPVGLVSGVTRQSDQPLLDEIYYLDKALDPFTEVRTGEVAGLLERELALLVLPDVGRLTEAENDAIAAWIDSGGVLVRFAGPRLSAEIDRLMPVRLRTGDRELGGALSWSEPARLAPFAETSPFAGLGIPEDVRIRRQVLAQPSLDLSDKTWARLTDGTPLVTGEKRGSGWLVLVHTTAAPTWSNLPLSGLFVGMLQKLVEMSRGVAGATDQRLLPPLKSVGGFGEILPPLPSARAIPAGKLGETRPGPENPPGLYGEETSQVALNLSPAIGQPVPLGTLSDGFSPDGYQASREQDLRPWILTIALLLAIVDLIASLALRGLLTGARAAASVALFVAFAGTASAQSAAEIPKDMLDAALRLRLGYVETGNTEIDSISRNGLIGLSFIANSRTAAELAEPMAVDPGSDELTFFPLLYWPMTPDGPVLNVESAARLNAYLKQGGTILIDTREQGGTVSAGANLRELARYLDLPPLIPMPSDHVLSRSYYLLREFPGRWTGGRVWVERPGARINDGVSSIVVGSNDWAAAWAMNDARRPIYPVVPGGDRQRELAYRFGINLVMYVLTGNYKEDQVHLPAILERLGQ